MIGRRSHDDAQSFEEAWNGRTPRDEHIADLVAFAEGLCEAAVVEPSLQFRGDLRAQLMTEAATVLVPQPGASRPVAAPAPRARARRGRRRIAGVTAALIGSAGAVSLVASSASALPGEMLYPVKRTVESVELKLHRDDASRGSFQLAQAAERLAEARQLSADGASEDLIVGTLDDFATAAADGSTSLFTDFGSNGEEQSIRRVNDFAATASVRLTELSPTLPAGADEAFTAATDAVTRLATEASSLCSSCTTADVQALVSAVTDLTRPKSSDDKPAGDDQGTSKDPAPTTSGDKPAGSGSTSGTPTVAPTTAPSTPAPAATTKPPSLSDITDPIIGGLLGDDTQEGLVPGLLNGLLGGGK